MFTFLIMHETITTLEPIEKQANIIPRVGDNIDVFYHPALTVERVILFPEATPQYDAIVVVG